MSDSFFTNFTKKPPVAFPLIALFHLIMLGWAVWINHDMLFEGIGFVDPVWMLLFTITWFFVTMLRKWAAFGYVGLTIINICIYYFRSQHDVYLSSLWFIAIIFCIPLMIYFRRFE